MDVTTKHTAENTSSASGGRPPQLAKTPARQGDR